MNVIITGILAAATIFIAYLGVQLYRQKMAQKHKERPHRMMVAIRRRQAGITRFLGMPPEEQTKLLSQLEADWAALNTAWQSIGRFAGGFGSGERGLSSGSDDEWMHFYFYDLTDYTDYRKCVALVDDEKVRQLRHHCEIRMMLGSTLRNTSGGVNKLF